MAGISLTTDASRCYDGQVQIKVCIVEDDPGIRESVQAILDRLD